MFDSNKWKNEGEGYYSQTNHGFALCAYIKLPEGHEAIGMGYDSFNPDVNGGLTFGEDNVFGWDYAHAYNDMNVGTHIANAIQYFKNYKP